MDADTSKHGPLLDEELKRETESLRRGSPVESRASDRKEGPGEDQPMPESQIGGGGEPWQGQELSPDEVRSRRELARHLEPAIFPAGRRELIASAERSVAPDEIVRRLEALPDGRFENVQAVWRALGGDVERRA